MKICITVKRLADMAGGAERVLTIIANGLSDRGHQVTIISFDTPGSQSFYSLNSAITWIQSPMGKSESPVTPSELIKRTIDLRKRIKALNPDIVISFMHSGFIPTAFACIGTGIKVVGSEHISVDHYKGRSLDWVLYFASHFFIAKITALSDSVKAGFPAWLRRKMVVLSNPVLKPASAALSPLKTGKNLLSVGRLCRQKDQKTLIEAFALLAPKYQDWQLKIVGDGPLRNDLQKRVEDLHLSDRVTLYPATRDIASFYEQADIFVVPSLYESFGMATIEAMMFGIPCIGFKDCPGTNELILNSQNGYLVDSNPDRVTTLTTGLDKLMQNEPERLRLGNGARETSSYYSVEPVISQWENLLQEVASS